MIKFRKCPFMLPFMSLFAPIQLSECEKRKGVAGR